MAVNQLQTAIPHSVLGPWRKRLHDLVFSETTRTGRVFTALLMLAVLISVGVVVLDSVASFHEHYHVLYAQLEWFFTIVFTVEYVLRLLASPKPFRYAFSAFGIIDLVSILPTLLTAVAPGMASFLDVRILRLARIFRVFKLGTLTDEFHDLTGAIRTSRRKIAVFLSIVILVALVMGTLMYVVEGPENGYTSIPVAVYWAITTMTTVGYGDIAPHTDFGRFIASCMMLLGWGTLAVPTGIVSAELTAQRFGGAQLTDAPRTCTACGTVEHAAFASFCHNCGARLPDMAAAVAAAPGAAGPAPGGAGGSGGAA